MTAIERVARAAAWLILAITVAFLMAPLVVVIGASLADSAVFDFPPRTLSWRWYQAIPRLSGFWQSIALSLQIAAVSTAAALALGTLAAIAVVQGRFPGRDALATFLVSPLMLPGLVIGVAILQAFRAIGLRDAYASLMIAHVVVTLPYVVRTVLASLNLFDFTLIDAARTLGYSYPRALIKVMVPALAPAFLTGGLFAFLASIDNYPISIFLTDVRNKTLPIQMLQYIEESPDPTIAAVSAMIIGFTILVLLLGDRMVGLRRAVALWNPARDFRGYGDRPPDPAWPDGARVAVSIVVNVEEGAELSRSDGDERNEAVYEVADEVVGLPDGCMESHFEYGTRAGYWRVMAALAAAGASATLSACGRALERSPWLARDAIARGHEIGCHGWRWERHAGMDAAQERAVIARAVAGITAAAGVPPVGWHTRSAPSANTRRLLVEHGGFLYDSDAYNDDLPYFTTVGAHEHLVMPYSFDTNDMHFHQGRQRFVTADDFASYVIDAYDCLWREGAHAPKLLSIGLHLRMIGRPGRIAGLERVLSHIRQQGRTWIARRDTIARHWIDRFGHRPAG